MLKARFVKVSNPDGHQDYDNSYWEVWWNETFFLMKIPVKEFGIPYENVATRKFGASILQRVKQNLDIVLTFR